ncbi:MAG: hypothetical protein OXN84_11915, partial [Albidovulum sp.]|nr:hypothetical protein [Albidovulum sp.]
MGRALPLGGDEDGWPTDPAGTDPSLDGEAKRIARRLRTRHLEKPKVPSRQAGIDFDSLVHEDPRTASGERICRKALEDAGYGAHRLRRGRGANAASGERARGLPAVARDQRGGGAFRPRGRQAGAGAEGALQQERRPIPEGLRAAAGCPVQPRA